MAMVVAMRVACTSRRRKDLCSAMEQADYTCLVLPELRVTVREIQSTDFYLLCKLVQRLFGYTNHQQIPRQPLRVAAEFPDGEPGRGCSEAAPEPHRLPRRAELRDGDHRHTESGNEEEAFGHDPDVQDSHVLSCESVRAAGAQQETCQRQPCARSGG